MEHWTIIDLGSNRSTSNDLFYPPTGWLSSRCSNVRQKYESHDERSSRLFSRELKSNSGGIIFLTCFLTGRAISELTFVMFVRTFLQRTTGIHSRVSTNNSYQSSIKKRVVGEEVFSLFSRNYYVRKYRRSQMFIIHELPQWWLCREQN